MIGSLTLDQLRVLVAIDDTGSFSAAGRKLRRVQSAISSTVQALEAGQGVQVFDRTTRKPSLTEAGKVLVAQARQVLRQADQFERTAGAIASGLEPVLTLAIDSMVPIAPLLQTLRALQATFPDLTLTLLTEGIWAAERRVRDGSAMIALCGLLPTTVQEFQALPLTKVTLVPVVAPHHPLAFETRPLTRDVLSEHVQLTLTDPGNPGGTSYSVVSPRLWRFVEMSRRLEFLLGGFGWCTMPLHMVETHLQKGELIRLEIDDPGVLPGSFAIYAIHARSRPPGVAARWLLSELTRHYHW